MDNFLPSLKTSAVLATASSLAACKVNMYLKMNRNVIMKILLKLVLFKLDSFLLGPCSLQGSPSFSQSSPQDSPEKATILIKINLEHRLQI